MGAVQFVLKGDRHKKQRLTYNEKQKIYNEQNQILMRNFISARTFQEDISEILSGNVTEKDINRIIFKYSPENSDCKISGLAFPRESILTYATRLLIQNNRLIDQNIDIFKFIRKLYNNLNLSENDIEKCKLVEERFQKEFSMDLKLFNYNITEGSLHNLNQSFYPFINFNLTINDLFQPNIMTVILDENIMTKVELMETLAESIRYNNQLQIVNLILIPKDNNNNLLESFGFDGLMYSMLFKLVEAVSLNRSIKSFFLHSIKDYSLILAPEISNLIIKKLQSETLMALHIGNFSLSTQFNNKLIFQFASTRSLTFVSMENKQFSKDDIITLKNVLSKNRSILAISIVSTFFKNMKPEIIDKFKSTLKDGSKLEIVYLSDKSLFDDYLNKHKNNINNN
jgi:hypothetical protein